jgi:hypothetical protein
MVDIIVWLLVLGFFATVIIAVTLIFIKVLGNITGSHSSPFNDDYE